VNYVHTLGVAADHPAYPGHFPGMPVLPGAVLLDEVLCLIESALSLDLTQWDLTAAKFPRAIRPGDALSVEHTAVSDATVRFVVRVSGKTALAGTLSRRLPDDA
jgi:3-hydroxyacyl-[acyl-carrier-protein] dehydratase